MKVIKVACMVFPNGQTLWVRYEDEDDYGYALRVIAAWKEQNPEYANHPRLFGGMVAVNMPEEDYNALPARFGAGEFAWPE